MGLVFGLSSLGSFEKDTLKLIPCFVELAGHGPKPESHFPETPKKVISCQRPLDGSPIHFLACPFGVFLKNSTCSTILKWKPFVAPQEALLFGVSKTEPLFDDSGKPVSKTEPFSDAMRSEKWFQGSLFLSRFLLSPLQCQKTESP